MNPKIHIILPVHDRIAETKQFVECLKRQSYTNYHLVLVDDGSSDSTDRYVSGAVDTLTILRGDGSLWWAGSLEMARQHLFSLNDINDTDMVMIANNDIVFDQHFLDDLLHDMTKYPNALVLAVCYDQKNNELVDKGMHVDWRKFEFRSASHPEDINILSTRGLMMSIGVFRRIGRFHPKLLPHYGSDYEYTHRAYKMGIALRASDHAKVYLNRQTTGEHKLDLDVGLPKLFYDLFVSKKTLANRLMWTNLILLSCSLKYIPINLLRVHFATIAILYLWIKKTLKRITSTLLTRSRVAMSKLAGREVKVILGSGGMKENGWISTDAPLLDITVRQSWTRLFIQGSINALLSEHVWEHLESSEAYSAARNCYDFLRPGGYLRVAVPDGCFPDAGYIEQVKPGGTGAGAEDHKVLYNYKTLSEVFNRAGFKTILLEYFDEEGEFHFSEWDKNAGLIKRSSRYDERNKNDALKYTSLIIDCVKPEISGN